GHLPVQYSETQTNPNADCNNTIHRTWTAMDSSGHTASCSQTISVNDTIPPVATTVAGALDQTLQCSDGSGIAAALAPFPAFPDNCTADSMVAAALHLDSDTTTPSNTCANGYVRVRRWSTHDG